MLTFLFLFLFYSAPQNTFPCQIYLDNKDSDSDSDYTCRGLQSMPFVIRQTVGNETVYSGFCMDLLRTMATQLNFRFVFFLMESSK